jgi:hypothetical protein
MLYQADVLDSFPIHDKKFNNTIHNLITKLQTVVTLSFVIIVLILLNHFQKSLEETNLTGASVSTRTDILKIWGHFEFFLQKLCNCCLLTHYNNVRMSVHLLWDR